MDSIIVQACLLAKTYCTVKMPVMSWHSITGRHGIADSLSCMRHRIPVSHHVPPYHPYFPSYPDHGLSRAMFFTLVCFCCWPGSWVKCGRFVQWPYAHVPWWDRKGNCGQRDHRSVSSSPRSQVQENCDVPYRENKHLIIFMPAGLSPTVSSALAGRWHIVSKRSVGGWRDS